jgi:hypothetical protein
MVCVRNATYVVYGRSDIPCARSDIRLELVVKIEERAQRREEEDRRLDAADDRQAAHDSRRRRTVRLPSHLRSGEFE